MGLLCSTSTSTDEAVGANGPLKPNWPQLDLNLAQRGQGEAMR